jgi:hypothetical protein
MSIEVIRDSALVNINDWNMSVGLAWPKKGHYNLAFYALNFFYQPP